MKITPFIPHRCEVPLLNHTEGTLLGKKKRIFAFKQYKFQTPAKYS
jgi:hypothetical protein